MVIIVPNQERNVRRFSTETVHFQIETEVAPRARLPIAVLILCSDSVSAGTMTELIKRKINIILVVKNKDKFIDYAESGLVTVIETQSSNFAYLRNLGIHFAKAEYVIFLDADEELGTDVLDTLTRNNLTYEGYDILVEVTFGEISINMWRAYRTRIVKRTSSHFVGRVHERLSKQNILTSNLAGTIINHAYSGWTEYYRKRRKCTLLESRNLRTIFKRLLQTIAAYFFNQGPRDGFLGLRIFVASINYAFLIALHGYDAGNCNPDTLDVIYSKLWDGRLDPLEKCYISEMIDRLRKGILFEGSTIEEEIEQLSSAFESD